MNKKKLDVVYLVNCDGTKALKKLWWCNIRVLVFYHLLHYNEDVFSANFVVLYITVNGL